MKVRKFIINLLLALMIIVVTMAALEGFSSFFLFLRESFFHPPPGVAERRHTRYDDLLGWINIPNLFIENMYGPGVYLRINSQSFRGDVDFTPEVPDEKVRIVCSGDSFTFGYGVDNDHTWPRLLEVLDNRIQTVNMAQGGYGVGQAYLWYRRDGIVLNHDIHLFALNYPSLERLELKKFLGYDKPRLNLKDGELMVENVPVPKRSFYVPWLVRNRELIKELKSVKLINSINEKLGPASRPSDSLTHRDIRSIALKILEQLQEINRARGSRLLPKQKP